MIRYLHLLLVLSPLNLFAQQDSIVIKSLELKKLINTSKGTYKATFEQEAYNKAIYKELQMINEQVGTENKQQNTVLIKQDVQEKMIIGDKHEQEQSVIVIQNGKKKKVIRLIGPSQYDSRIEPLQLDKDLEWQNKILQITESVGMIVEREKLTSISKNLYQLDISQNLGKVYRLCPNEAFFSQPIAGVGTAFICNEKNMLSALHVFERPLEHYAIVFGYKIISKNGVVDVFIDKNDIYYPQSLFKKDEELDVVEFIVDRKFNRPVLEVENSKAIDQRESEIYMVGYPNGLPIKLALNASIVENDHQLYFYTSLDSFQGNSGSPVFNFYTNKVIGILVSGEIDYKFNGNCNEVPLCKYPHCKGEKVIRIEQVLY